MCETFDVFVCNGRFGTRTSAFIREEFPCQKFHIDWRCWRTDDDKSLVFDQDVVEKCARGLIRTREPTEDVFIRVPLGVEGVNKYFLVANGSVFESKAQNEIDVEFHRRRIERAADLVNKYIQEAELALRLLKMAQKEYVDACKAPVPQIQNNENS